MYIQYKIYTNRRSTTKKYHRKIYVFEQKVKNVK